MTTTATRHDFSVDCYGVAHLDANDMFLDFLRQQLEASDMRCSDGYIPVGPFVVELRNYPGAYGPRRLPVTVDCDLLHDDPTDDDHRVRTELDLALVFNWLNAARHGLDLVIDVDVEAK